MARDPAVVPMLAYEDGPVAMDWLARAFEFRERMRMLTKDCRLSQGEMEAGDGLIMLATPTPAYQSPKHHREGFEAAGAWSTVPYIIDDVEAHFERAQAAGATILSAVETGEHGKRYRAEDLEGHRWMFMRSVRPNLVAPARQR
jgi:uncharacterized glyoxalase superfamily protein PhnB